MSEFNDALAEALKNLNKRTNADRIRSMTDEELAEFMIGVDELRNQPILLFPKPKNEVYFADKDHVWINGRQYISLKRVGEMMKEKRMTNADRIRAMTDEELADEIFYSPFMTKQDALDWLKQEAAT